MKKIRLFTPGPTMVPAELLLEMAQPVDHHRTPQFQALLKGVTENLQYLFQTGGTCLSFTSSGTAAMEGAIVSCCPPGSKALVSRGGKFGERWAEVCQAFGINNINYDLEWGYGAKAERVAEYLNSDPEIKAVIITHSETSTATVSDVEGIARVTRERDVLLLVDGITSVGAIPVKMDEWGIDVLATGSQKALMLPPRLAFAAVNDRAWQRVDSFNPPAYYVTYKAYRKSIEKFDTPPTPNNAMLRGAAKALESIREEGIENVWARTALYARATRAAAEALGLKVFSAEPVDSVTAIVVPDGIDEGTLRKRLRAEYGAHLAGGQAQLKGKIVRISHMGYVDAIDTVGVIAAMELILKDMGHPFDLGAGLTAAQKVLAGG